MKSFNNNDNTNTNNNIKNLIKPLYPSNKNKHGKSSSSSLSYGSGSGYNNILSTERCHRQRFSHLLLEHGERHLQDWAVIASSSPITNNDSNKNTNGKNINTNGLQQQNRIYNRSSSSSSATGYNNNDANNKRNNNNIKEMSSNLLPPSSTMGKIEGRLHLCSRSIVFEPTNDITRGIIRFPIHKLHSSPYIVSSQSSQSSQAQSSKKKKEIVEMKCNRHMIMKVNNIISPYEIIDKIPLCIRFTFLHSSPNIFIKLVTTIYNIVSQHAERQSIPENTIKELDIVLEPLLNHDRPFDGTSNFVNFVVNEKPLTSNLRCFIISPLLNKPGVALLTNERLYFQPSDCILANDNDNAASSASKAIYWNINKDLIGVARRYNGLRNNSLEICLNDNNNTTTTSITSSNNAKSFSILLNFHNNKEREIVMNHLLSNNDTSERQVACCTDVKFVIKAIISWLKYEITTFDYLLVLNCAAGRSCHDLSRCPIFPWITLLPLNLIYQIPMLLKIGLNL